MKRGVFCVIEGIDGAGGETQAKLLKQFLAKQRIKTKLMRYPDYEGPIGKLIDNFLHEKFDLSADVQFSLYATDMIKDKEKINKTLKEGGVVIADRYITSTLSYQVLEGFSLEKGLKFAEIFGLPKPDIVIFLDISPETSVKRKFGEKRSLDRHEKDKKFLGSVRRSYLNLIKGEVFAKEWVVVDGEKSIEEVSREVQKIVLSRIK